MARKHNTQAWSVLRAFLAAELFKLRYSTIARAGLIGMCLTPPAIIGIIWGMETNLSYFPYGLQTLSASLWLLAGLTTLLMTANLLGSEFELDTVRVIAGRGTPRWVFIAGKGIILLGISLGNALAAWFCGGIAATISHLAHVGTEGLGQGLGVLFTSGLGAVGVVALTCAAYIGVVMVVGILTHSPAFTIFGGLSLFMVDFLLSEFKLIPGLDNSGLASLSIVMNTNVLLGQLPHAGIDWVAAAQTQTRPGTALLVLLGYAIGGMALAFVLFERQDIAGK
ncbi:MAG: ABC transporter permease [Anaerolineae bacterium]|nr:ABC transporter permease [Anaerolineae bacterium]